MLGILGALADPRKDPLVDCEPRLDTQRSSMMMSSVMPSLKYS